MSVSSDNCSKGINQKNNPREQFENSQMLYIGLTTGWSVYTRFLVSIVDDDSWRWLGVSIGTRFDLLKKKKKKIGKDRSYLWFIWFRTVGWRLWGSIWCNRGGGTREIYEDVRDNEFLLTLSTFWPRYKRKNNCCGRWRCTREREREKLSWSFEHGEWLYSGVNYLLSLVFFYQIIIRC